MVDRIEKLDPSLYRVQESKEDGGHREQQEEEEEKQKKKEKDRFDKGKPFLNKIVGGISDASLDGVSRRGSFGEAEEASLSLSQRVLVAWGILDLKGKPRAPVIATYGIITTLIVLGTLLILGILWP